jgi:gluconolactonase
MNAFYKHINDFNHQEKSEQRLKPDMLRSDYSSLAKFGNALARFAMTKRRISNGNNAALITKPVAGVFALCLWCFSLQACQLKAGSEGGDAVVAEGAEPVRAASGFAFTEGPAADSEGNIYFTDQPNNRILIWNIDGTVSVFMENAGRANGLFFDHENNLLACADEHNQLWRITSGNEVEVLVADVDGKRLNGPNDLWVTAEGGIYFTDPYFQRDYWSREGPEIEGQNLYYLSPGGELMVADDDLVKPNGIIGNEAGDALYVADAGAGKTYRYAIAPNGVLEEKREFVPMGSDGMTIDQKGNVYLTGDGVTVFDESGEKIRHIAVDAPWTSNVTFGGKDGNILFITASDSVYTLEMNVQGAR